MKKELTKKEVLDLLEFLGERWTQTHVKIKDTKDYKDIKLFIESTEEECVVCKSLEEDIGVEYDKLKDVDKSDWV